MKCSLTVNGTRHEMDIGPGERLLAVLRDRLGLTGTKLACGVGECGACTVLVDDRPVQACITLAATVRGQVRTIERTGIGDLLRQCFADEGGFQCGFCTPGQLMSAQALLERCDRAGVRPTEQQIRAALTGNVCRCTGYAGIVRAVEAALSRSQCRENHHDRRQ